MEQDNPINHNEYNAFEKAMDMMHMMSAFNELGKREMESQDCPCEKNAAHHSAPYPSPPMMDDFLAPEFRGIKAAMPYLEPRQQRAVSIMIKVIELQRLLNAFNAPPIQPYSAHERRIGMLRAIRGVMPPEDRSNMDILISAMSAKGLLDSAEGGTFGFER